MVDLCRMKQRKGAILVIGKKRWVECPSGPVRPVTPSLDVDAIGPLVVRLRLQDATPIIRSGRDDNEWKMLAVGFPVLADGRRSAVSGNVTGRAPGVLVRHSAHPAA